MAGEEASFWGSMLNPEGPVIEVAAGREVASPRLAEALAQLVLEKGGYLGEDGGKGDEPAKLELPLNPNGQSGAALALPTMVELDLAA